MATPIDQEFFARLRTLNDKFAAGVPDTLARLHALGASFDPAAPQPELVAELREVLHTIAGSAATFGYRAFGQQARVLEQNMRVLMTFETVPAADWRHWLETLERFVARATVNPKAEYTDSDSQQ